MRVTRNSQDKIELVVRITEDGKRFYNIYLYDNFMEHKQEVENGLLLSYECDMVKLPELEFGSDSEAMSCVQGHFRELWNEAERLERDELVRIESREARSVLEAGDHVSLKAWEMVLKGASIKEAREWVAKDKGASFLKDRDRERDRVNGIIGR